MADHTPGPWSVDTSIRGTEGRVTCARGLIANTGNGFNVGTVAADTRLIAAAPDLLEALQLVLDTYGFDSSTDSSIWQTVTAALAKATAQ